MPELPEVEIVKRGLSSFLPSNTIASIWYDWPKGFPNAASDIDAFAKGATVESVRRRAKMIVIALSSGYSLVVHLKMTGQLVFRGEGTRFGAGHPTKSLIGTLPDKTTRVIFTFTNGDKLFFNDVRKFGWIKLVPNHMATNKQLFKSLGPEPFASNFTSSIFVQRVRRRKQSSIKAAILDQTVIAGVGNIYADEALFLAGIHPSTKVINLKDEQLERLHTKIKEALKKGIDKGGSTDKNYIDAFGNTGSYLTFAQVFRRDGKKCKSCGTIIQKIRVAGRGTHICYTCQIFKE